MEMGRGRFARVFLEAGHFDNFTFSAPQVVVAGDTQSACI